MFPFVSEFLLCNKHGISVHCLLSEWPFPVFFISDFIPCHASVQTTATNTGGTAVEVEVEVEQERRDTEADQEAGVGVGVDIGGEGRGAEVEVEAGAEIEVEDTIMNVPQGGAAVTVLGEEG